MAKKHNNKNVIQFDRNRAAGPWQRMQPMEISAEGRAAGVVAAFRNNRYATYIKQTVSPGFLMQGPDGKAQAAPVVHLIIVRGDGRVASWKDIQRIKNELVHEESDAVEIFPAESRRVDASQTHLWCLPPGIRIPLGMQPEAASPMPDDEVIPGVLRRSDLQFYVVETPQEDGEPSIVEVFADEQDARASYEITGVPIPETAEIRMLGAVPVEEEGAAWSPGAIARRDALQERIAQAAADNVAYQQDIEDQVRWPDHPPGLEEELEADGMWGDPLEDGPLDPIEQDRLATAMEQGIAQKREDRTSMVSSEEQAARDAGDEQAAVDLARMREQLVRTGSIDGPPSGDDLN